MASIAVFFSLWFWLLRYLYVTYRDFYEYLEQLYGDSSNENPQPHHGECDEDVEEAQ